MTPEAQRIAIAEACGWTWSDGEEPCYGGSYKQAGWTSPTGEFYGGEWTCKSSSLGLPDYLSDLNAMHSAEWAITDEQHAAFRMHLRDLCKENNIHTTATKRRYASSTAAHRAEAFLRTLNLYTSL